MAEHDEPASRPVGADQGETPATPGKQSEDSQATKDPNEESARGGIDSEHLERRLAEFERMLTARLAELDSGRGSVPPPSAPTGDASPANPAGPTLSARLRAHKRALGDLPPVVPAAPGPAARPSGEPAPAFTPPNQATEPPPTSPEQEFSVERDDEEPSRRSGWLVLPPILVLLVLVVLAIVLLRPHGQATLPVARQGTGTANNIVPNAAPTAAPAATATVQTTRPTVVATGLPPATVTAVLAAASVLILQSTATAVPTATPIVIPSPPPSAVPTTAPAVALLSRVAAAESALRSGQLAAAIDGGSGTFATATLSFDLGNSAQPRLHLTTTYASTVGTQSSEQVTIGEQGWQRQANGQWAPAAPQGVFESVQPYLPHAASVATATLGGGGSTLMWFDAGRAVEVTLSVDPATGIPRTLVEVSRDGGARRTITYSAWNTPIDIRPPPGT